MESNISFQVFFLFSFNQAFITANPWRLNNTGSSLKRMINFKTSSQTLYFQH